jgi:hypothetical protein
VTAAKAGKRKRRTARLVVLVLLVLLATVYSTLTYVPVQMAIYPEDLDKYDNVIAVKGGHGAPTYFIIIGDSTGLYDRSSEKRVDVQLIGMVPPRGKPEISYGSDYNVSHRQYVCFVEYSGKQPYGDMGVFDTYTVNDWAPLGPIDRSGAPAWLMPRGYTCLWDVLL